MKQDKILLTSEYSLEIINRKDDFIKLSNDWDKLAYKQGSYFPFLCHDWFIIWLDHFLNENELLIVVLYKNKIIEAIAPFVIKREKFQYTNVRKVDLIGNIYSPIRYLLFNRWEIIEREKIISFILGYFSKIYQNWNILDFNAIPEENNCFDVIAMAIENNRLKYSNYFCYGDWYLDKIGYSGDEYIAKLSKKIRKDVPYCQRRLKKIGNLEFKIISNPDLIDEYIDVYYEVYSKSWQKKEAIGPFFHRDLAKMSAKYDWLRLGFLFLDGCAISSQFWISCYDTAYILKTVYDQNYKKFSPGKILTAEMMKYVIDVDKVKAVDYVQGDESYKKSWTSKRRDRKGILVYNTNIKSRCLAGLNNRILPLANKYKYLNRIKKTIVKRFG